MKKLPNSEKTTVLEELRMVHPAAWALIGLFLLLWVPVFIPVIMRKSPNPAFVPLVLTLPAVGWCLYIFMIFWVNADSKRRHMNSLQWTLISALVPFGVGFVVYLASRQPIPQPCPACGAAFVKPYPFCPSCGARRNPPCPACGQPVELQWRACAHCGRMLASMDAADPS